MTESVTHFHSIRLSSLALVLLCPFVLTAISGDRPANGEGKTRIKTRVVVHPPRVQIDGRLNRLQLVVVKQNQTGIRADITRSVRYESRTPQIVRVSPTGQVTPVGDGSGLVRVHDSREFTDVPIMVRGFHQDSVLSFTEDVVPILTRFGCNQGGCHGAQFGQGGFKLSLFGFAPHQDHEAIVRQYQQRRISTVNPAESLLLQKAVSRTPHGGGQRFQVGSLPFQTLQTWIQSEALGPAASEPALVDIVVFPTERTYDPDTQSGQHGQQLRVEARYSNNTVRDVTHLARYDSLSKGIASVSEEGYVTAIGRGQSAIMVRYRGQAKVSLLVSPFAPSVNLAEFKPHNFIDEHVKARWEKLGLQPSPLCDDSQFIRRAYLASIGTLPTAERVESFLASQDERKRTRLIDQLLGLTGNPTQDVHVEEWTAFWAQKWGDLLRNNRKQVGDMGMWAFSNWIRSSLRENKPMDQFVREILEAQGSIYQFGQANYYKVASQPTDLAETTAQVFLGVRLQCARCHQHPMESVSQADYYRLAAFFTRVSTKRSADFGGFGLDTIVRLKSTGSIKHPRTGEVMLPTPLGGKPVNADPGTDLRRPLAEWLTAPENPWFARNIVNRVWGYLMGVALVEPIDDLRATNPASHPALLDALADDFVAGGYDMRKLMRAIMVSRVFQLSSTVTQYNADDSRFFSHYMPKRLPAEVLLDAIDVACGTREQYTGVPLGTRAIELPDPNFSSYFLDTLGRPQRLIACECERTAEPNLAQVLHLVNGELVHRKLTDENGRISQMIDRQKPAQDAVRQIYLVTLSRFPTDQEIRDCQTILEAAGDPREGLEDILWAIINGREFLFNH